VLLVPALGGRARLLSLGTPWHASVENAFGKQVVKDPENSSAKAVVKTGRAEGNLPTAGEKTSAPAYCDPA